MSTSSVTIRRVSYSEILTAHNAQQLIDEYAAECSIPDHNPQAEIYAAMEKNGVLVCFGAYVAGDLVGFVSMLTAIMPHNGKRAATIESLFVLSAHRDSGAGNDLLAAAEYHAAWSMCVALLYTARIGSRLDKILSRRAGCEPSHTVFTRWL